jgi:hypothetical protein
MSLLRMLLAAILAAGAFAAQAQDKACTKPDSAAAEKALDRVVTWSQLQKAWQDYRQCDAGNVDALFTDALMRMLVEWKTPDALAGSMDKDPAYAAFVMKHIKSPAAKEDRESVYSRAKQSCPPNLSAFCEKIAEASKP